jgi:hypothetical protein
VGQRGRFANTVDDRPGAEGFVRDNLAKGQPVIVGVKLRLTWSGAPSCGPKRPCSESDVPSCCERTAGHFVLVTGLETIAGSPRFLIDDPGNAANRSLDDYDSAFVVRGWIRNPGTRSSTLNATADGDDSALVLSSHDVVQLLITDPSNRRTGFDRDTGTFLSEVPDSVYGVDLLDDDETGEPAQNGSRYMQVDHPASGTYRLTVAGVEPGPYTVIVSRFFPDGRAQPILRFEGTATEGSVDTFDVPFGVSAAAPRAADDSAVTDEDTPVDIDVLANDSDADGDPLLVTAVTQGAIGNVAINRDGTVHYAPNPDANGSDAFTYTVSDGDEGEADATVHVDVRPVNDPPVAVDDVTATKTATPVDIAVLANDADPDGDTLTVESVAPSEHGTTSVNGDGSIRFVPEGGFVGIDTFSYTVTDAHGGSATASVRVDVRSPGDETTICSILGDDRSNRFPDLDAFKFRGVAGEEMRIEVRADPTRPHRGARVGLAVGRLSGALLARRVSVPFTRSVTLDTTGSTFATLIEQWRSSHRFRGGYCLTLRGPGGATLHPTRAVE